MSTNTVAAVTGAKQRDRSFAKYNYPLTPGEHNIVMVFREYDYTSTQSGFVTDGKYTIGKDGDQTANARATAGVTLPIPQNLSDTYNVKVGPFELGASGSLALDALTDNGRSALANDIRSLANGGVDEVTLAGLTSTFKAASAYAGRNLLDSLPGGGGIAGALDISSGTAINPHVALKFDGVDLKQHTFNWQLSPRNSEEAEEIKKMIYFIKSRMLPDYKLKGNSSVSRALFNYPNLIDIYFTGINQSYFYYFKPAMINTFTTDFTPQGLALNKGGKPSFINMTMTVTEAQIHTRSDIEARGEM